MSTMKSLMNLMLITAALFLSGCVSLGDTGAIRGANKLAIECRHDEALSMLDRARQSEGLSAYLAELETVVFLRDLGRDREAAELLEQRNARVGATAEEAAEAESAIEESLAELRKERGKKLGRATCAGNEAA